MLGLASMVWAAYMYVASATNMRHNVPPPMVIEKVTGGWNYDLIYSELDVPTPWKDDCYSQRQLVYYMVLHFNAFRNGNNKMKPDTIDSISRKWVCVTDTNGEE